jgi:hypothetical protein
MACIYAMPTLLHFACISAQKLSVFNYAANKYVKVELSDIDTVYVMFGCPVNDYEYISSEAPNFVYSLNKPNIFKVSYWDESAYKEKHKLAFEVKSILEIPLDYFDLIENSKIVRVLCEISNSEIQYRVLTETTSTARNRILYKYKLNQTDK